MSVSLCNGQKVELVDLKIALSSLQFSTCLDTMVLGNILRILLIWLFISKMATAGVVGIGTYAPSFYRAWWGRAAEVT